MARRFSPEFNQEARKIVKGFNQRVRRAEQRGMKNLPQTTSMRELKARFSTEKDLKRELSWLKQMTSNKEALGRHFLGEGSITNWEFNYIKENLQGTKRFYDKQLELARQRYKDNPFDYGIKQQVLDLEERRDYLNRDLSKLSYSELRTFRKYITAYKDYERKDQNYYDSILGALDDVMAQAGIDDAVVGEIKNKIASMDKDVFIEVYRTHDIIGDMFDLAYQMLEKLGKSRRQIRAEDKLSPEDRAIYEQQEKERLKKFRDVEPSEVNKMVGKIVPHLNVWEVEAEARLGKSKEKVKDYKRRGDKIDAALQVLQGQKPSTKAEREAAYKYLEKNFYK